MAGILIYADIGADGIAVASGKWGATFGMEGNQAAVLVNPLETRTKERLSTLLDCLQVKVLEEAARYSPSENAAGIFGTRANVLGRRDAELRGWGRRAFSNERREQSQTVMWWGRLDYSEAAIMGVRHQGPHFPGAAAIVVETDNLSGDAELIEATAHMMAAVRTVSDEVWAEIITNATNGKLPV